MKRGVMIASLLYIILLLSMSLVSSELFLPSEQRSIQTGNNTNWYYIEINKVDKTELIGIDKNDRGAIGIGEIDGSLEIFGRMWLVPAFKHPSNSKWYLCPIRNMSTINEINNLGNGWYFDVSDSSIKCYRYDDPTITGTANLNVKVSLITDSTAKTKITVNTTVYDITPEDTGFGFLFFPQNQQDYRYVYINDIWYDLAGIEGQVPIQKVFNFFDSNQNPIGHLFDWTDMLDVGSLFSEIITLGSGGQKGLLIGSYGYGSSTTIEIDPIYSVDYSPIPGKHLIGGNVTADDNQFTNTTDITTGISDNNDTTTYEVCITDEIISTTNTIKLLYHFNNDSNYGENDTFAYDFSFYENNGAISGAYYTDGKYGQALNFDGTDDYVNAGNSVSLNITGEEITVMAWIYPTASADKDVIVKSGAYTLKLDKVGANLFSRGSIFSGATEYTVISTTAMNLNEWYHIVMVYRGSYVYLYQDGVQEGQSTQCVFCNIDENDNNVIIAGDTNYFQGRIDEVVIINESLNLSEIQGYYSGKSFGKVIIGKWSQTYDSTYNWWIRLRKTTSGSADVTVYAYYNNSMINTSQYITKSLDGVGWFNINVSSLMNYENNIVGLNYTHLRFFSNNSHYFSEMILRKEVNDTQLPIINNCQINDTYIINNEVTRLKCNVTDDVDVDYVNVTINEISYSFTKENDFYYYDFTCLDQYDGFNNWSLVEAWDILANYNSTNPNLNFTCFFDSINITLIDYYALNSTYGRIDNLTSQNLEVIEYFEVKYKVTSKSLLGDWYFNYTAGGINACALGNKQSSVCYSYPNFIQFINNTETDTFDGRQWAQGDYIIETVIGNWTDMNITYRLDDHYNPNIFKWYDAIYNLSNIKWQNGTEQRITNSNIIRVTIDGSNIPLDADQYKLEVRVGYEGNPSQLEVYVCNSSFTTGELHTDSRCSMVIQKYPSELLDVGTLMRGIFTRQLINGIGDIKYVFLSTDEVNISNYYYIKSYKSTKSNYTTHWDYSTDSGLNFYNLNDSYETELHLHWYYDGASPTSFIHRLFANTTNGTSSYAEGSMVWDIDPTNNYPPIIHILTPYNEEIISVPYNVTYYIIEPNDDNTNGNLSLYYTNGTLYQLLAENLNQSNTTYVLDENPGTYDLELYICELNTSDLYCSVDINRVTIDNPPIINYCQINDTSLLTNQVSRLECNVTDDVNISYVQSLINTTFYNFTKQGDMYYYDWLCNETGNFWWNITEAYDTIDNSDTLDVNITFECALFLTNLSVFSSKNPVEILEEYVMYANFTDVITGQPILNATCYGSNSSVVGGGQANWGRGVIDIGGLSIVGNAIHTQTPDIWGNNTIMVRIENVPLNKTGYGFNFRFNVHEGHAQDDLRVYANCNNSLSFNEFTLIDTVDKSDGIICMVEDNDSAIWGFRNKVIFGFTMPTSNCSIMFESINSTEENYWKIADTISTLNLNNSYYSDDFGATYILRNNSDTRSPFVDMAIGLSIPNETTMTYNSTTGLYFLNNIRHGRPFTFRDKVICSAGGYENATDYVDMILQDNVPPITQIISINPDPAEVLVDNVTIHWAVNDAELLTSFINVSYPNGSLLMQSEDEPFIINSSYLTVIGNYSVVVFANDTGGLISTDNGTFEVICITNIINTSWSAWSYFSCLENGTMNQSRYKIEYDSNFCGVYTNVTYYEYQINDTCNYCSEDIVGPYYDPLNCPDIPPYNQTQYYIDNDYDICCVITGLFSDCSILYAPYVNTTVNCSPLITTIEIDVNEVVYLDDRMYFMARINETNSTKCWSYVKKEGKILQTNPQKTEYSMSVLMRKKTEDREYFTPVKGRVNAYWTDQNIIPYDEFVLGVRCALDNGSIITGEKHITHEYQDLRRITARSVWGAKEMSMLVITIVLIIFTLSFVIYAWKK